MIGVNTSLVLDYCDCDLKHYINHNFFNINIFKQMCQGVQYLHNNLIMHRDLKPENILLQTKNEMMSVKVADFGLARKISTNVDYSFNVVTLFYRAPEILFKKSYGLGVDIWSLGCIFVEMLTKEPPYVGYNNTELLYEILNKKIIVNDYQTVLDGILCIDKQQRININQLIVFLTTYSKFKL